MKRLKASVLAAILAVLTVVGGVLGLANTTVKAADQVTVSVDTVEATAGQKDVTVAVKVGNPGKVNLGGLQLEVTWDKTALQLKPEADIENPVHTVPGDFQLSEAMINLEKAADGFLGYADASARGKTGEGSIILMKFDVLDGAKTGLNPINVNILSAASATKQGDNDAPSILDITQAVNGGVKVAGGSTEPTEPTKPGTIKLSVDKVTAKAGDKNVKVNVNVENSGDLAGLQFGIKYDTAVLKATSAVAGDFKLSSGQGEEVPEINTEKMAEGVINYADASATGTDKSGTVMVLTFDVLDGAKTGESAITIDETVAAKGADATALTVETVNGAVTVEEAVVEECKHPNVKDSDYKVTKEPTYTEAGVATAVCPDCNKTLTREIPKLVCEHKNIKDSDYVVTKEPTVAEEGIKEAKCPDCGQTVTVSIPKLEDKPIQRPDDSKENIKVEVKTDVKVTVGTIPSGIADKHLTQAERDAIAKGGVDTNVNINVNDLEATNVPQADKDAISKLPSSITIGTYLDINVTLQVGANVARQISSTSTEIAFTVAIPENLLSVPEGYERRYTIIRVHNGVAVELPTTKVENNLSFASDLFSTYAIAYEDTKIATDPTNPTEPTNPTNPTEPTKPVNTGDTLPIALFVLMIAGLAGIVISSKKRA